MEKKHRVSIIQEKAQDLENQNLSDNMKEILKKFKR